MKKIIKFLLILLVLLLIILALFMFRNSFSSFISKITGKSTTEVANPIFVMENTEKKVLNDENTELNYYFSIKNYNDNGERSQTDLKYIIEILPTLDSSIVLTLYKDNQIISLKNQKTDYIVIEQDSNITHNYRLNVKYDREKTNSTTDINESIYIKASAIQM